MRGRRVALVLLPQRYIPSRHPHTRDDCCRRPCDSWAHEDMPSFAVPNGHLRPAYTKIRASGDAWRGQPCSSRNVPRAIESSKKVSSSQSVHIGLLLEDQKVCLCLKILHCRVLELPMTVLSVDQARNRYSRAVGPICVSTFPVSHSSNRSFLQTSVRSYILYVRRAGQLMRNLNP
ncbi:hypothetical protein M8818_005029 [Zalaria obscura]|uniref:Uncharacterized protein n=1 Tax=Zalaria obscura TaxID=2024903 RepID=A0ACC3SD20_9PEZI